MRLGDRPEWQRIHVDCHARLATLVFGRIFSYCEHLATGVIRVALAAELAGSVAHFRRVLKCDIKSSGSWRWMGALANISWNA